MNIDLCIATFRRPMLADTLASLDAMTIPANVRLRVIVVDNDHGPSASQIVERAAQQTGLQLTYVHAPAANISIARNAGLDAATAEWIAFLDDDETVSDDWLVQLVACVQQYDVDAVFGPSIPIYPADTPEWIKKGAFHRQAVPIRQGRIETGHTCNGLVRMGGTSWATQRFDLRLGRSGGEDTAVFAGLYAQGARFHVTEMATVYEAIPQDRLSFRWLAERRFRIGQTYGALASGVWGKTVRCAAAVAKAGYCFGRATLFPMDQAQRNWWALRGVMHSGVCAGCISNRKRELYGVSQP